MPSKNKIRSILLWLHRWAGALAGLVILVITVTGGILVFEYTLQQWLRPDLYPTQATAKTQRVPVAESLAMFREKRPSAQVQGIR
ncbi:MAG: PepSY domain-containing protein, partial [Verrucomicrobiales bacterium]|nr:PepSY domain-containing protein [Verrucomicrobiales bacterium]